MFSATKKSQKSSAQKSSGFGHFLDASRGELHSRKYFNTYHLFLQAGCLGAEAKILSLHSASKQSFSKTFPLWSYALHTAVTFLCEESYQRHTKNLLVFGFPAEGGTAPFDPLVKHQTSVMDKGERDRFAVTAGAGQCYRLWKNKVSCHSPRECRFAPFSNERVC